MKSKTIRCLVSTASKYTSIPRNMKSKNYFINVSGITDKMTSYTNQYVALNAVKQYYSI